MHAELALQIILDMFENKLRVISEPDSGRFLSI